MPPVMVLDEGLRWPGKDVSIKQSGGLVTFSSVGSVRDCQLKPAKAPAHSGRQPAGAAMRRRPRCGWDQGTLVVVSGEPEEDHPPYEQRFSVSADGQQLVEVVVFQGRPLRWIYRLARLASRACTRSAAPRSLPQ